MCIYIYDMYIYIYIYAYVAPIQSSYTHVLYVYIHIYSTYIIIYRTCAIICAYSKAACHLPRKLASKMVDPNPQPL